MTQGIQGHVDARQQHAAFVVAALRDDAYGNGGAHVDGDDGRMEFFQSRNGVRHDVRAHLALDRQANVQPGLDAGPHHHGGLSQQAGQGFFHHEVQRRHHTAQNSAGNVGEAIAVKGEEIHQVNGDLIGGLAAVGVQRRQKAQRLVPVEKPHGSVGVANINGKQHRKIPLSADCLTVPWYHAPSPLARGGIISQSMVAAGWDGMVE